ncbi:MAG: hypothetical protein IJM27_09655 [Eubacterium sp.]|nr:hypothetical protein [Eubacterium sp.]
MQADEVIGGNVAGDSTEDAGGTRDGGCRRNWRRRMPAELATVDVGGLGRGCRQSERQDLDTDRMTEK